MEELATWTSADTWAGSNPGPTVSLSQELYRTKDFLVERKEVLILLGGL